MKQRNYGWIALVMCGLLVGLWMAGVVYGMISGNTVLW